MIRRALFLLLLVAATATIPVSGQEMRTVNGEKYIAHTVEKGETLFGISRHFAVPVEAITQANPSAAEGLSIGQVVLIPVKAQSKKDLKTAPQLGGGELLHTVAKKETIFGIARKYGVTQEELQRWNPDLQHGLSPGMVLRIQSSASVAVPPAAVQPAASDSDRFHLVQPGETLFSLGQLFNLPPERIKEANGGLPDGLKAGTYLRIPRAASMPKEAVGEGSMAPKPAPGAKLRIAVLLPFTTSDTAATMDDEGRSGSAADAAVEFHAGMGMALDTLQAQGLDADVFVFDTGMKPAQWTGLFKSDAIKGMDLYIGPFHRAAIESLVKVAGPAPVVCPVPQSNKVLLGNPSVSKAVSGRTDRLKQLARFVARNHGRDNIILLKPEIFAERDVQDILARELQQALLPQSGKFRDSLLAVPCARRDMSAVVAKLTASRPNILVVPSEDVELVTTALTTFSGLSSKYAITVYGMNAWTTMGTLDLQAMMKLNVHVPASAFIDYASPAVNDFIAGYRARYHNEPGEYAFLGYDVALFFIRAAMEFGNTFPNHFAEVHAKPVYLDFRMAKLGPENGWSNTGAVVLEYGPQGLQRAK